MAVSRRKKAGTKKKAAVAVEAPVVEAQAVPEAPAADPVVESPKPKKQPVSGGFPVLEENRSTQFVLTETRYIQQVGHRGPVLVSAGLSHPVKVTLSEYEVVRYEGSPVAVNRAREVLGDRVPAGAVSFQGVLMRPRKESRHLKRVSSGVEGGPVDLAPTHRAGQQRRPV